MRSSKSEYLEESPAKESMESVCVFPPGGKKNKNGQKQQSFPHNNKHFEKTTCNNWTVPAVRLNWEEVRAPTFVDAPQPRVGAHVLKVAHVLGLYDEPVIGSEGGRQEDEAQQTADPRCDHHSSKCYLHDAQLEAPLVRNAQAPVPERWSSLDCFFHNLVALQFQKVLGGGRQVITPLRREECAWAAAASVRKGAGLQSGGAFTHGTHLLYMRAKYRLEGKKRSLSRHHPALHVLMQKKNGTTSLK